MSIFKTVENQSLIDLVLQVYGDVSYLVKLCIDNGLDINQDVIGNTELMIDDELSLLSPTSQNFILKSYYICTSLADIRGESTGLLEHSVEYSAEEYS